MKNFVLPIALAFLSLTATITPAHAQQASAALATKCNTGTSSQQVACLQSTYEAVELNLNEIYKGKIDFLVGRQQFDASQSIFYQNLEDRLRISQRAWLQDRESQCEMEAAFKVQAEYIMATTIECNIRFDIERTNFLKNLKIQVK